MLGLGKLNTIEAKFEIYEDLSKSMLEKLERAVGTISENSNRVAIILERHENRLDEGERTNEAIMKLVERVEQKVDKVEERVNQLSRFRWIVIGCTAALVTVMEAPDMIKDMLTSRAGDVSMVAVDSRMNEHSRSRLYPESIVPPGQI
jgi:L-fucose isomerase-like protein